MPQPLGPQQPLVAIAMTPKNKNAKRTIFCPAGDTVVSLKSRTLEPKIWSRVPPIRLKKLSS
jgi:hypothetical protein